MHSINVVDTGLNSIPSLYKTIFTIPTTGHSLPYYGVLSLCFALGMCSP